MHALSISPLFGEPGHYVVGHTVIEHDRLSFRDFQQIFGGNQVINPVERSKFSNVHPPFVIWKTAKGDYRCIKPE